MDTTTKYYEMLRGKLMNLLYTSLFLEIFGELAMIRTHEHPGLESFLSAHWMYTMDLLYIRIFLEQQSELKIKIEGGNYMLAFNVYRVGKKDALVHKAFITTLLI